MGIMQRIGDGLINVVTGAGTSVDKRSHGQYLFVQLSEIEIANAYRSSWLHRKVVDLPATEMTRAWRDWQAEGADIELIEAEERRHNLRAKVREALVLGRLGGGAIIIGDGADPSQPLAPKMARQSLRYLHVVSRWQLGLGAIVSDPESEWFGQPSYYSMTALPAGQIRLHPSRVVAFRGLPVLSRTTAKTDDWFWGDSVIQAVMDAVRNADSAQNGFASLIDEAKTEIIRFAGLAELLQGDDGDARLTRRVEAWSAGKSIHRMGILDKEDEFDTRQVTWNGMPDVLRTYLSIVASAADIPATRLLGKSPDGQNATGKSDEVNFEKMISAHQESDLRPALDRIDAVLVPSALGRAAKDEHFTFAPLSQLSEIEKADVDKKKAETVTAYVNTGLIPERAFAEAVQNMLVEDSVFPGLEGALATYGSEPDADPEPLPNEVDPSAMQAPPAQAE